MAEALESTLLPLSFSHLLAAYLAMVNPFHLLAALAAVSATAIPVANDISARDGSIIVSLYREFLLSKSLSDSQPI
jgi:hypothetical protein